MWIMQISTNRILVPVSVFGRLWRSWLYLNALSRSLRMFTKNGQSASLVLNVENLAMNWSMIIEEILPSIPREEGKPPLSNHGGGLTNSTLGISFNAQFLCQSMCYHESGWVVIGFNFSSLDIFFREVMSSFQQHHYEHSEYKLDGLWWW